MSKTSPTPAMNATTSTAPGTRPRPAVPGRPPTGRDRLAAIEAAEDSLQRAQLDARPACNGDERFIGEDHSAALTDELTGTCLGCPLLEACADYAEATRPGAGFWAGRWRGSQSREAMRDDAAGESLRSPVGVPSEGAHFPCEEMKARAKS